MINIDIKTALTIVWKEDATGAEIMLVKDLAIRARVRAPMLARKELRLCKEAGIEGDHFTLRNGADQRQVTILSLVQWEQACREIERELSWFARRANILVTAIEFAPGHKDALLEFAGGVVLQVTGETTPCIRMDQEASGLREALRSSKERPKWRGGVTCRIIKGGVIKVGSGVTWRN